MESKMKNKFLVLLTVIFLSQLYLVSSMTINSVTTSPSEVQPGEKFSLDLEIENNLEEDIENVVVSLDLEPTTSPVTGQIVYQPPFSPYKSSNEIKIDEIDSDDDEKASFDLMVFSDAVSGTYNIPVHVEYEIVNGTDEDEDFVVSVIVNAKPEIDISLEDSVLIKGTKGELTIKIVNSGLGDAKFLKVELSQTAGIQITNSNSIYIGNIDSNDFDTADFNVFVSADALSSLNLPVKLTYTDSGNNQVTENKVLSVRTYTPKEATDLGLINRNNTFTIILSVAGVLILFLIYRRIRKKNRSKRSGQ